MVTNEQSEKVTMEYIIMLLKDYKQFHTRECYLHMINLYFLFTKRIFCESFNDFFTSDGSRAAFFVAAGWSLVHDNISKKSGWIANSFCFLSKRRVELTQV